jgi:hypothetical protein
MMGKRRRVSVEAIGGCISAREKVREEWEPGVERERGGGGTGVGQGMFA